MELWFEGEVSGLLVFMDLESLDVGLFWCQMLCSIVILYISD